MRSLAVFTIALFIFSTHICLAQELNGNLDYTLKSEDGIAKLKIINKRTDTPVQLKSVTIILSAKDDKEQKRIEVPISPSQQITENVTIELGNNSDLAQHLLQIARPNEKISQFKSINISEDPYCQLGKSTGYQHCETIGFAIEINTEYENGNTKQSNLTAASMNYMI